MRRTLLCPFAILSLFLVAAIAAADLAGDVDRAIKNARLGDVRIAVSVRDADSGRQLVEHNQDQMLIPASNMKLLTSGAALHVLGPAFEFETRLLRDGDRLIVLGDGDPGFGDPVLLDQMNAGENQGMDIEAFLKLWTTPVADAGLTTVRELVIDDRVFDRQYVHPSWPRDQLNRWYCTGVSGVNLHTNVLRFFPRAHNGERPDVTDFRPLAGWLVRKNRATSRSGPHDQNTFWISRSLSSNDMVFHGNVKFDYREPVQVALHNMPTFFGDLLVDRLHSAGVTVNSVRLAASSDPPSTGTVIAPVVYTPISTALKRCNTRSHNLYAEALLKRLAHQVTNEPGGWENGATVMRHVIHERLDNPTLLSLVRIADGSGMSRDNRVAASVITAWLNSFHRDPQLQSIFLDSLARPGENGTLQRRFRNIDLSGGDVRAKSGYLDYVSSLSGYVTMPNGERRSFSILVNDLRKPGSVSKAKRLQEQIVAMVAADMANVEITIGGN